MKYTQSETKEEEVLICGDCGRVNTVSSGENRSASMRCSGCGVLLRADRARRLSIHCPSCRNRLEIEPGWLGHSIICGSCSTEFVAKREGGAQLPGVPNAGLAPVPAVRVGQPEPEMEDGVLESQESRRKVRRSRKRKKTKPKSWGEIFRFFVATVATFALVGGVIAEVGRRSGWWLQPEARSEPAAEVSNAEDSPEQPVMESEEGAALDKVLKGFAMAPNPDELLGYSRFPSEVGERFRSYYGHNGFIPDVPHDVRKMAAEIVEQTIFLRFDGKNSSGKKVSYIVERVGKGEFLVDWDSHVRYAAVPWDTFVSGRDSTPRRFQLFMKRDFAGNPHFPVDDYSAFYVFWQDEVDGASLFVKRGSQEEEQLLAATEPGKKLSLLEPATVPSGAYPVTLEVLFPANANQNNQPAALVLKRFVHSGWVDLRPGRE